MNTPADKPDLPTLPTPSEKGWIYEAKQLKAYGRQCADEREAWARADERRKARAELIAEMEAAPVAYEVQRVYVWVPELFFNLPKAGVIEAKPLAYIPTKENHE